MNKSILRKTTSMTALFSFIYLGFTGILLYITPPGRIAYWADWHILGMSKTNIGESHTTVSMLFLISMVLHIWLNWKPIVHYMSNKSGKLVIFTKETVIGFTIAIVVFAGTLMSVSPFYNINMFIEEYKEDYEYTLGNPPYGHAELTPLATFIKKMRLDEDKAIELLSGKGYKFNLDHNLKRIAQTNNVSPKEVYDTIKDAKAVKPKTETSSDGNTQGLDMSKYDALMGSGMGKKTVADAAEKAGISVDEAKKRLAKYGISALDNDRLKDVAEIGGVMPMDVFIIIDSGIKPEY